MKIAASKDQEETEGSKTRQTLKDIETATTNVGEKLLGPMNTMRDALVVAAGMGSGSLREKAAKLEKDDINTEIDRRIAAENLKYNMGGTAGGERLRRFFGAPGVTDETVRAREAAERERDNAVKQLEEERSRRLKKVEDDLTAYRDASTQAAASVAPPPPGAPGGAAAPAGDKAAQLAHIAAMEKKYGLPAGMLKGIWGTESGFGKNLYNAESGATGHFQFLPSTAASLGVQLGNFESEAEGAAKYMAQLKQRRGTWKGAMFAYNGVVRNIDKGEKYVQDVQKYGGFTLDESTPLPAGAAAPQSGGQQVVVVNGEFKLVDQNGRERAAPAAVQTEFKAPRSAGVGAR